MYIVVISTKYTHILQSNYRFPLVLLAGGGPPQSYEPPPPPSYSYGGPSEYRLSHLELLLNKHLHNMLLESVCKTVDPYIFLLLSVCLRTF